MIRFIQADNDYISSTADLTIPASGTFSFWLYRTSLYYQTLFYVNVRFQVILDGSGNLISALWRNGISKGSTSNASLSADTLYHVAITFEVDGSDYANGIYIEGVLDKQESAQDAIPANGAFNLAKASSGGSYSFGGQFEDVRLYDRVLSAEEISTIYACRGTDGIYQGLAHRWRLDEGAPASVVTSAIDEVAELNLNVINGTPEYTEAEIRRRRVA